MDIKVEWDENKNELNKRKHGLSFDLAIHVFEDPDHIELLDSAHSQFEERFIAIGRVNDILFVVFTERGEKLRIISAREATKKERRFYYDHNP